MTSTIRALFADRLRQARKLRGLTQAALADRLGVAKTTYIQWEKSDGKWQPSWEQLAEICRLTRLPSIWFFFDDGLSDDEMKMAAEISILPLETRKTVADLIRLLH